MSQVQAINPDLHFIREVKQAGGDTLKKCYQCATCSMVCELSPDDHPFPRKEMLWTGWGQADKLIKDPDVWLCYQCNDCSSYCPRGARPGDVLAAVRAYVYKRFAFPSFMGRALATPKALPLLIGVPILILLACVFAFAPHDANGDFVFMTSQVVDFNFFLPHSSVDALFVLGNILVFLFAAIGFVKFWKGLQTPDDKKQMSFVGALFPTVKEIISHKRFRDCGANAPRSWGHMILLFGFVGAMITTGAILVFVFLPHYLNLLGLESIKSWFHVPIELPNPVKILGVLSGTALVVGGVMLVYRRWANKDAVGANGYVDYLFLYVIFFAGLTGMLSYGIRLTGIGMLAYVTYFIHMVTVFFLLWYMPYSKFAHMIYRTLALVHARQIGRLS